MKTGDARLCFAGPAIVDAIMLTLRCAILSLSLILGASGAAHGDNYGFFYSGALYRWNLDHPEIAPVPWSDIPFGRSPQLLLLPDERSLVIPLVTRDQEKTTANIVVVDAYDKCKVAVNSVNGITGFSRPGRITGDGTSLFIAGETHTGQCMNNNVEFSCLVIDMKKYALSAQFCATDVWIGPEDRAYYFPYPCGAQDGKTVMLSRDCTGANEREEVSEKEIGGAALDRSGNGADYSSENETGYLSHCGKINDAFALDNRFWVIARGHYGAGASEPDGFVVWTVGREHRPHLEFRHAGVYICRTGSRIYYRSTPTSDLGIVDCLSPTDDQVMVSLKASNMKLEKVSGDGITQMVVSPDGKKLFFFADNGERVPLAMCVYDVNKRLWSEKHETPLSGGPAPVVVSIPSSEE